MLPELILEAVSERDVDLLILEEMSVNRTFIEAFLAEVDVGDLKQWKVFHSVTDSALGETDLLVKLMLEGGISRAVMIENKIDAIAQPEQANRYKLRGEAGIENGDWSSFSTCVMAPERYLQGTGDVSLYDHRVSYEKIIEILQVVDGIEEDRRRYRIETLKLAIEQQRRGYTAKMDERVTEFWQSYHRLALQEFPELNMPTPKNKPGGAGFIIFKPRPIEGTKLVLRHKFPYGKIDIQTTWPSSELVEREADLDGQLDTDVSIVKTGKSCSISVSIPQMDSQIPFEDQEETARLAMQQATRLLEYVDLLL